MGFQRIVVFCLLDIKLFYFISGLNHEGIFRVSGNTRIMEKLRSSYDRTGSADLNEAGDIMAVACLLKQFLRELPDSAIPEAATTKFVQTQEGTGKTKLWLNSLSQNKIKF